MQNHNPNDELNLENDKFSKQLDQDERILLSCNLFKFNDYKKRQERSLLVSTKNVINLKGTSIKRKIPYNKIKAITLSSIGTEFVIHVPDEYDYRYSSYDKRNKIVSKILEGYCLFTKAKLAIYFKEDVSLYNYATTKSDKKKHVSKIPSEQPQYMDNEIFAQILEGETKEKDDARKKTQTLWAREKGKEVTLDDFSILKVLGRGAFGQVMLVEKKDTGEWFAMKTIRKEDIIEKDQLEHTKTEKMILEHVNHPFLVNLAYAFQTPQKLFFIMQFMKGGELFQHLRMARKFDEKRAKFYVAELLLGLGHLHSKDIVYRDLKLENILMDDVGNVFLTDFGMAKIVRKNELAMTFCGTPEYLCPEVILGYGCDKTADWWSLGILTYEMMYGLPPFYNKNQTIMFKLIKEAELRFPERPEVSKEAKDFISRLLVRDRFARLGAKGDFQELIAHPWFKDINWEQLIQKKVPTPYKPRVQGEQWLDGFDKDFTSEDPNKVIDDDHSKPQKDYDQQFKDF
ncbi:unnamed protein product (macronuclear) [Paramecium tetraurelia]|uniref:non-specific serine/threonine protein kinase n=1 Tax=Paramecium tetraurelia TaxID=5888 RepID=A0D712_PARTE|nr:uncharacterized protein GSPATT00001870001 [Paramecium tetraurelia]CAK78829.1 unnamed protein product [Paramecium tetraurelia]|eukprot:XP_001446226.1 hypothetical protein (macronuclear) [Paramecium tetraurelia strain d4-2]